MITNLLSDSDYNNDDFEKKNRIISKIVPNEVRNSAKMEKMMHSNDYAVESFASQ